MKTLFLILIISSGIYSQVDSAKLYCKQYGHLTPRVGDETQMYCPEQIYEYADSTVRIIPGCNWIEGICPRCSEIVRVKEKDVRIVIPKAREYKPCNIYSQETCKHKNLEVEQYLIKYEPNPYWIISNDSLFEVKVIAPRKETCLDCGVTWYFPRTDIKKFIMVIRKPKEYEP